MTREERDKAIKHINDILTEATQYDDSVCYVTSDDADALKAAIKALEQEPCDVFEELDFVQEHKKIPVTLDLTPCDDAISRQAMHIELEKWITYGEYKYSNATKYLYDRIDKLPPVNPQPKTGHWIDSPNGYFTYCSECGLHGDKGIYKHYGWCPKCGARMVEPQESEGV